MSVRKSHLLSDTYAEFADFHARNLEQRSQLSNHDYLVGVGGLTGPCLGVAVEAMLRSVREQPLGNIRELTHEGGRKYSKLLLRFLYQHLPKAVALNDVTLEKHPHLIEAVQNKLISEISEREGIEVSQRGLVQGRLSLQSFDSQHIEEIVGRAQRETAEAFLLILRKKTDPLLSWHVVGLHPATQTFVDVGTDLIWKGNSLSQFLSIVPYYIRQIYGNIRGYDECQLLGFRYNAFVRRKSSQCLLLADRLVTTYAMSQRNLAESALFLADSIPFFSKTAYWILQKTSKTVFLDISKEIKDRLCRLLEDAVRERKYRDAVFLVRSHKSFMRHFKEDLRDPRPVFYFLPIQSLEEWREVFQMMADIQNLGAETEGILSRLSCRFVRDILPHSQELFEDPEALFPYLEICVSHMKNDPFRAGLALHTLNIFSDPWRLCLLKRTIELSPNSIRFNGLWNACADGHFQAVKAYVESGVDPFSSVYAEQTPLIEAERGWPTQGKKEVVAYLKSL